LVKKGGRSTGHVDTLLRIGEPAIQARALARLHSWRCGPNGGHARSLTSVMHMEKPHIPVAILVRVSTAKQETARKISELRQYADGKGYEVIEVCQETISGSAEDHERDGLRRTEQLARDCKIKKVLVHEISRIARRNSVAHRFVETLEDCNVSLYWHA